MFFGRQSKYTYLIAKKTSNLFKEKEVILQEHVILLTQLSFPRLDHFEKWFKANVMGSSSTYKFKTDFTYSSFLCIDRYRRR